MWHFLFLLKWPLGGEDWKKRCAWFRCEYPRFPIAESGAVRSHHFMRLYVYVKVCVHGCMNISVCRDVPAVWEEGCFVVQGFLSVTDLAPRGFPWCPQYHWCFNTWKTEFSPKLVRITEKAYVLFILFSFSRFMTYFWTQCHTGQPSCSTWSGSKVGTHDSANPCQ